MQIGEAASFYFVRKEKAGIRRLTRKPLACIQVEAYSPIAHGEALKNTVIVDMAKKYGVSPAQLCIRYVIQLETVALPKTADAGHMADNTAVDFELSQTDMGKIKHMDPIRDYGKFSIFPVFSGKQQA